MNTVADTDSSSKKKAFDFIKIMELPPKPRKSGIIEIRGPYYTVVTPTYLDDLLEMYGDYIDGFKFAGGSQRLLSIDTLKRIIDICHKHDVYVSTGGFVERVIVQGSEAVDRYLEECKRLGFDMVEVSSGLAPIPLKDKAEIIRQVKKLGMKPKPEISLMVGAGAGTHIVGYQTATKLRTLEDLVNEINMHLKVGAEIMMVESEGLTEDLQPEEWRTDIIKKLDENFGFNSFMFEASDPPVFKWYLKNFGPDVNLFIDHSQIVEFTAWKTQLWGDRDIWKDKHLQYHIPRQTM
jgi:phosphosulfolactate synthase (CoM biosynthesis protein A)